MIIGIVGGIGSNKTLSIIKLIKERGNKCFTNFELKGINNVHRLKYSDIMSDRVTETKKDGSVKKSVKEVNFGFWEKQMKEGFDIYIDEIQAVVSSRRSMSKENVVWSSFISQIRKVLGASEKHNFYFITQRPNAVDIQIRELTNVWILCNKVLLNNVELKTKLVKGSKMLPMNIAVLKYFRSLAELEFFNATQNDNVPFYSSWFFGNQYYKYYDSHALVDFRGEYV